MNCGTKMENLKEPADMQKGPTFGIELNTFLLWRSSAPLSFSLFKWGFLYLSDCRKRSSLCRFLLDSSEHICSPPRAAQSLGDKWGSGPLWGRYSVDRRGHRARRFPTTATRSRTSVCKSTVNSSAGCTHWSFGSKWVLSGLPLTRQRLLPSPRTLPDSKGRSSNHLTTPEV